MDPLLQKNLLTTSEASALSGYNADYIGRLCRSGEIVGKRLGRSWLVEEMSLKRFIKEQEAQKSRRAKKLAEQRVNEYRSAQSKTERSLLGIDKSADRLSKQWDVEAKIPSPLPIYETHAFIKRAGAVLMMLVILNVGLMAAQAGVLPGVVKAAVADITDAGALAVSVMDSISEPRSFVNDDVFRAYENIGITFIEGTAVSLAMYEKGIFAASNVLVSGFESSLPKDSNDASLWSNIAHVSNEFLAEYLLIVERSGEYALALGEHVRDGQLFGGTTKAVAGVGNAFIETSNNVMAAHEWAIYTWVDASLEIAPRVITAVHGVGLYTGTYVANIPYAISETYDTAVYAVANPTADIALALTGGISETPALAQAAPIETYREEEVAVAETELVAAPVNSGVFEVGRSAALYTYVTINNFFENAGNALAALFKAPTSIVITQILPPTLPPPVAVAPPTPVSSPSYSIASGTTVQNITNQFVTNGVSYEYLEQRLRTFRTSMLDRRGGQSSSGGSGGVTSVDASGGTTGLSFAGGPITSSGTLTLSGTLEIDNGGTGLATLPAYGELLMGDGLGGYSLVATSSLGIGAGVGAPGGADTHVQYNDSGLFAGEAGFTYDDAANRLAVVNASTTNISSTNAFFDNVTITGLSGVLRATAGVVSTGLVNLATEVTGTLAIGNGGTGATTLNDLITLATHTTGPFVRTITGNPQITVGGVGAEDATATLSITADSIGDSQLAFDTGQNLTTTSAVTFATVDTGQGANELFDMNQNVQTSDAVTFATVDTGQGANELFDMDQNVLTTSSPTFAGATLSSGTTVLGVLTGTIDAGGATSFEVPNGAAPTVDVFGELAGDNNLWGAGRGAPLFFDGTAATALVNVLVSDTPANGQVPTWNTGGTITWETVSGGGGGDITSVGDVASGAAFDGTQGTTFTFNNAGGDGTLDYDGTDFTFSHGITALTLDTGQGANELYDMDQNVLTSSAVTFATVDTGQGANELFDMDQNVLTSSSPTFAGATLSSGTTALGTVSGTIDAGGATSFEVPNGAAPTVNAFGELAGDNNLWGAGRGAPVFFDGTDPTALVNVLVSDAPSNGQVPTWNTGGTITWETVSGGGGGDITSVGDVTSGAAFDGTQGTVLTFNDAGGDGTFDYDGTSFNLSHALTTPSLDTGQGANELYDMDQNVLTTSSPTFAALTLTAPLTVANGGSGAATFTGGLLVGDGTNPFITRTLTGNAQITVTNGTGVSGNPTLSITADSIGDSQLAFNTGQNLTTTSAVTFATVDTGQGANELYDMDQNVLTTSPVTFATVDTGQGANELFDMDQNVLQASTPTFAGATLSSGTTALGTVTGTVDAGGATSFEIPNGAAPTVDAFGELAGDNNLWGAGRGAPLFFDGTDPTALVNVLVSDTPSNGQVPTWNTGGTITWETVSAGAGDISSVGDVTSGAAFDGTQGTILTFNDAGGDGTFDYDGTSFNLSHALTTPTLDTGQGANELYDMDQNVLTSSGVTFATVDTGQGANELFDMDQNVLQASTPTFAGATLSSGTTALGALSGTIDAGGATSFEVPNGAAPTVDAFGEIAGDNNLWDTGRGAPLFFDGTAATALVNVLVSDAPSNGQVPTWNTGGTITWETISAGAGDITSVGDVTSGAAFDGTQGTILTFDDAGGDGTFDFDGTSFNLSHALTAPTLDTGQGANELYDMDQNVLTSSGVTFATVDTGQGANELFDMDQNVLQASAVTFATVDTGQGANELYDMDQNVLTTSSPTFAALTLTAPLTVANGGSGAATFTGGLLVGNGTNAFITRTLTGNAQITVTDGSGVSGNPTLSITADSIGDTQLAFNTGQNLTSASAVTFATVDTGQGANELYDMDQNVQTTDSVTFANVTLSNAGALRTGTSAADTLLLQARDVDGAAYTTFGTLTANNTPTFDLSDAVTKAGGYIYRGGGTDVAIADGGTGASSLNDLITLATHTTGNFVATITGSATITSSGATTGENIAHTLSVTADSIGDTQLAFNTGQNLTTASAVTFATVDTGQGANELYDMNQNVQTSDAVTFATVNTGNGAYELFAMDQNVLTSSSPSFAGLTLSGNLTLSGTAANILLGSNFLSGDGGDEGISVNSTGVVNTSGTLTVGGGTGKITVGTIDPVYTIDGISYATYVSGMIGQKEEVTGFADITTPMTAEDGTQGYAYTIEFDEEEAGSDLWLFGQATNIRKHIDQVAVLLSSEGGARVWYSIDRANRKVYLLSDTPTRVSFRMTAPRFDSDEWTNYNHDGIIGFTPGIDTQEYFSGTPFISFDPLTLLSGTTTVAVLTNEPEEGEEERPWSGALATVSDGLKDALASLTDATVNAFEGAQYFADGIFKRIFAGEIHTDELCISDENGETCITKAQLDALLAGAAASGNDFGGNNNGGNSGGGGGADDGGDTGDDAGGGTGDDGTEDGDGTGGGDTGGEGDAGTGGDDAGGDGSGGDTGSDGGGDTGGGADGDGSGSSGGGEGGDSGGDSGGGSDGGGDGGSASGGGGDAGA